jgi:hypothetical protein
MVCILRQTNLLHIVDPYFFKVKFIIIIIIIIIIDELHSLYSSQNIVRVLKSRKLRWAGHVARMGRGEVFTGFWLGGPKARNNWEDLGVGGKITLRCTLGR